MHFLLVASLLDFSLQFFGAVYWGIVAAVICRIYFVAQIRNNAKNFKKDIIKSQAKIIELEATNEQLQKRLKEMENYFSKDKIIMN